MTDRHDLTTRAGAAHHRTDSAGVIWPHRTGSRYKYEQVPNGAVVAQSTPRAKQSICIVPVGSTSLPYR